MKINRKNMMKPLLFGTLGLGMLAGLFSCGKKIDDNSPGVEFMPDMYRSPSLEVYNYVVTRAGDTIWSSRQPVAGTISKDHLPGLPPSVNYDQAATYKNPLAGVTIPATYDKYANEGKELFGKFCVHCHGADGKGEGKVALKMPGGNVPSYSGPTIKDLPEGKIFYSISHGKGMMGSHAAQLSVDECCNLVCYVQTLQGPKTTPPADSVKVVKPVR
ncbi:MAG: cytochrome c [Bacteroidia bacterium]|nr:cytochrome c [Bacteroidia bacterium]